MAQSDNIINMKMCKEAMLYPQDYILFSNVKE